MASRAEVVTQVACTACAMSPLCRSRAVSAGAPHPVESRRHVPAGDPIYVAGSPRDTLYALRAGSAQLSVQDGPGTPHVVRFLLPGDAFGLDAFADGVREDEARALEDCEVCAIPAYRIEIVGRYHEATCELMRALLSRGMAALQSHACAIARLDARQRMARFLLDLSQRWGRRGYSASAFRLPMRRQAIARHLALSTETVSRILCEFQTRGWIDLPRREVVIRQPDELRALLEAREVRD